MVLINGVIFKELGGEKGKPTTPWEKGEIIVE